MTEFWTNLLWMSLVRTAHRRVVWNRRVEVLASRVADALPEGARVLDIGCGDGAIAAAIMQLRPDVSIKGVDVLVRPVTHVPVAEFDGKTAPYPDESFTEVTFIDVLHHTEDPVALLAEARRLASRSIVIKDHLAEGLFARPTLRLMDWVGNASFGVALPYNYLSRSQWQEAFRRTGLDVSECSVKLNLYSRPLTWLCDRQLHVLWKLNCARPELSEND